MLAFPSVRAEWGTWSYARAVDKALTERGIGRQPYGKRSPRSVHSSLTN